VSFSYPEDWYEVKESAIPSIINEYRLNDKCINNFTILSVDENKNIYTYLLIAIITMDTLQSLKEYSGNYKSALENKLFSKEIKNICNYSAYFGYVVILTQNRTFN
jgi:hypothetical protein